MPGVPPEEATATQVGDEEATAQEIENLLAKVPPNLHAALAKRLTQAGVADNLDQQQQQKQQQQQQRSRSRTRESSAERKARLGSRSRTP